MSGLFHLKRLGVHQTWQRPLLAPVRYDDFTQVRPTSDLTRLSSDQPRYVKGTVTVPMRPILGGNRFLAEIKDSAGALVAVEGDREDMEEAGRELAEEGQIAHLMARLHTRAKGGAYLTDVRAVPTEWRGRVRPVYPYPARLRVQPDPEGTVRDQILSALPLDLPEIESRIRDRCRRYGLDDSALATVLEPFPNILPALSAMHLPEDVATGWAAQEAVDRLGQRLELALLLRPWAQGPDASGPEEHLG